MSQVFRSPMRALAYAAAALLGLARPHRVAADLAPSPGPHATRHGIPLAPPRRFHRREINSRRSRYMPHQGKREQLRRRMGGFAGVPQSVQTGLETPESWYERQFGLNEGRAL